MKTAFVLQNQTLLDLAVLYYGSAEGIFPLMEDNPHLTWWENPAPGTQIKIKSTPLDPRIVEYFAAKESKPATQVSVPVQTGTIHIIDQNQNPLGSFQVAPGDNITEEVTVPYSKFLKTTEKINVITDKPWFIALSINRYLFDSWVGNPIIRVRRVSDNQEFDMIPQNGEYLTVEDFVTTIGLNETARLTTIYNQTGVTARDFIQTSAALQHLVYYNGVFQNCIFGTTAANLISRQNTNPIQKINFSHNSFFVGNVFTVNNINSNVFLFGFNANLLRCGCRLFVFNDQILFTDSSNFNTQTTLSGAHFIYNEQIVVIKRAINDRRIYINDYLLNQDVPGYQIFDNFVQNETPGVRFLRIFGSQISGTDTGLNEAASRPIYFREFLYSRELLTDSEMFLIRDNINNFYGIYRV